MHRVDVSPEAIAGARDLPMLVAALSELLSGRYGIWADGQLIEVKRLVDRVDGLVIEIFPREHPPPHFHVRGPAIDASFAVETCELLRGPVRPGHVALIKYWHRHARARLIEIWNATRPSDCQVGPIAT